MFETIETQQTLLDRKLAQMRAKAALPAELLDLVARVLALQNQARGEARIPDPDQEDLAPVERVLMGAPLLARERFPSDQAQAAALFAQCAGLLAGLGPAQAQAAS